MIAYYMLITIALMVLASIFIGHAMHAGGSGRDDARDNDHTLAATHAIGSPIPLFDRDRLLVEVMTRTPQGYRYAAPGAGRHDGDCRPRSIHPGV